MVAGNNVPEAHAPPNDGRYAIDIRLFIAIVSLTMTVSFMAGMYGVTDSYSRGGSYNPSYVEAVALRFLFPNLIPESLVLAAAGRSETDLDTPNHSDVVRDSHIINEDEHRPSGQHLLVDIKGVDADFLNSEELLSKALVDTVKETGYVFLFF